MSRIDTIPVTESAVSDGLLMIAVFLMDYPTVYSSRIDGLILPAWR